MKKYTFSVIMHEPKKETGNRYLAEIPLLGGSQAWGKTPDEALENIRKVAIELIRTQDEKELHSPLPGEDTAFEMVGPKSGYEITITV
jgi:predicted RNase H-like HicB family nuclease